MRKLVQNAKGFTLIELMIVVAIIGILAAIAIPQFAAYRIRGFNSSALSDTKNLQTSEHGFFADNQLFGVTGVTTAFNTPADVILVGGTTAAASTVISQFIGGAARNVQISLGNQVHAHAKTDATATSYTGGAKHFQGDTVYGVDSDTTLVYQNANLIARDAALTAAAVLAPTAVDDYAAIGGQWVAK